MELKDTERCSVLLVVGIGVGSTLWFCLGTELGRNKVLQSLSVRKSHRTEYVLLPHTTACALLLFDQKGTQLALLKALLPLFDFQQLLHSGVGECRWLQAKLTWVAVLVKEIGKALVGLVFLQELVVQLLVGKHGRRS